MNHVRIDVQVYRGLKLKRMVRIFLRALREGIFNVRDYVKLW